MDRIIENLYMTVNSAGWKISKEFFRPAEFFHGIFPLGGKRKINGSKILHKQEKWINIKKTRINKR